MSEQYTETPPTKPGAYWWKLKAENKWKYLVEVTAEPATNEPERMFAQMAGQTGGSDAVAWKGLWCGPLVPEAELTAARDTIGHLKSQMGRLQDQRDGYRAGAERLSAEIERLRGEIALAFREGYRRGCDDGHEFYCWETPGDRCLDCQACRQNPGEANRFNESRAKRIMEGKE